MNCVERQNINWEINETSPKAREPYNNGNIKLLVSSRVESTFPGLTVGLAKCCFFYTIKMLDKQFLPQKVLNFGYTKFATKQRK